MKGIPALLSLAALALIPLLGCERKAALDIGEFKEGQYRNDYFNLTVPLPEGWSAQDDETRKGVMQKGIAMAAGDDKNLGAMLRAGEINSMNMFLFSRHPLGTPTYFNQNITGIAENIKLYAGGIKEGRDYFFHLKQAMNLGRITMSFADSIGTYTIGGREFDVLGASMDVGTRSIGQKYYCTIINGFAVVFILSFGNPEQEADLIKLLGTIRM